MQVLSYLLEYHCCTNYTERNFSVMTVRLSYMKTSFEFFHQTH